MKEADFDKYVASAKNEGDWNVVDLDRIAYPYLDIATKDPTLAMAYIGSVQHETGEAHTVVVSYRETDNGPDFSVWCGDRFLDTPGLSEDDAKARVAKALENAGLKDARLTTQMMGQHATKPASSNCSFWLEWRKNKKLCEHTNAFLAQLRDTVPGFKEELVSTYSALTSNTPKVPVGDTMGLTELAFQVPVLVQGDRGAGKTFEARAFARANNFPMVEFGGHESVESLDLLGYQVQAPDGKMVWKDGPLSEAFRRAQTTKVVLLLDELLRVPTRQLSILLTAFSPDEGFYRLRTGRIVSVTDGVAQEETLSCPTDNLCVIATTNVGAEFAVDEIDPAIEERFCVLHKDSSEEQLRAILTKLAKEKGFKVASVNSAIRFFNKMAEARTSGLVARSPTTRTISRSFQLAKTEADIKRALKSQALLWAGRTHEGAPIPEQVTTIYELVDGFFK